MREIYLDESSQTGHAFMVLGAAVVPGAAVSGAQDAIEQVLQEHNTFGELKWTKVSGAKLPVYRALVDRFFELVNASFIDFNALIVDCAGLDHQTYNQGDTELGFNKFVFQLLHHRVSLRFGDADKLLAYLDSRSAARHPRELQTILNQAAARALGIWMHAPFSKVVFRDSKTSRLLQMVDLLTGAIAWHKNDHDTRPEASPHKSELANQIAGRLGRKRLGGNVRADGFNVWNFRLRTRAGGAR